jgi:hypothetical protein
VKLLQNYDRPARLLCNTHSADVEATVDIRVACPTMQGSTRKGLVDVAIVVESCPGNPA